MAPSSPANPLVERVAGNIGWLLLARLLRMGLGFFIAVWLARYLGPEQYGWLSYALALVMLAGSLAELGLRSIVVREIVRDPERAGVLIGTALGLQCAGALLSALIAALAVLCLDENGSPLAALVSILVLRYLFQPAALVGCWFEARVQSRVVVLGESAAFLLASALRIAMLLAGLPLQAFAWALLLESALTALVFAFLYRRRVSRSARLEVDWTRARALLCESWPLMLTALAIMVYFRIDQIMIGAMLDEAQVGIYAAALQLSEIWYVLPTIIMGSLFPSIVAYRATDRARFRQQMQSALDLMVLLAALIIVPLNLCAGWIVQLLYGADYAAAAGVLVIHSWAGLFVFMGVAGGKWFLAENLQRYALYRTLTSALLNVALNFLLIPLWGIRGAALATLVSQVFAAYLLDLPSAGTREIFLMKTRAFLPFSRLRSLRILLGAPPAGNPHD